VRRRTRRSPRARLILTLAALLSLVAGYYLGQYWQRRPLAELSAVVYPDGRQIEYPGELAISDPPGEPGLWRLFLAADTRRAACRDWVREFAFVINRLAAWPEIQANLRLTVLAYDQPDATAGVTLTEGAGWVEIVSAEPQHLDRLSGQLGILPSGGEWCSGAQANSVLVSPQRRSWALIPHQQAAIMARNLSTIIAFVE
jgi:hypothetical protein